MLLLPNFEKALIAIEKLADYCLSAEHVEGKHKAIVFKNLLNLTSADAEWLKQQILAALPTNGAVEKPADEYGRRFYVDFYITKAGKGVKVRSAWIIKASEEAPKLTSCYIID